MTAYELLPAGLAPEAYVDAYLDVLGVEPGRPGIVRDAMGERIAVGPALFDDANGALKLSKRGLEQYLRLLTHTPLELEEIWARVEWLHGQQRAS